MGSIMRSLYIARDTLLNSQLAMEVTSNNIANAENSGYARQRAVFTSNPAYQAFPGWVATGARVTDIAQDRDRYLERRLLSATSGQQDFTTRASSLRLAETYLAGDGSHGIATALGEFWDAWDNLQQNPQSASARTLVHATSGQVAATVSESQSALADLATELQGQIGETLDRTVNPLLEQVAAFNRQIVQMEASGHTANELRDLRYQALTELAREIPVQFSQKDNGAVTVTVGDKTLVEEFDYAQVSYDDASGTFSYEDVTGPSGPLGSGTLGDLGGGRVNGLVQALASTQAYHDRLDAFAAAFAQEVNAAHTRSDGTSVAIFALAGDGTLQLDTDFDANYASLIQADRANAISELQNQPVAALDDATFAESLTDLQTQVGYDITSANHQADFQSALLLDLQARQQDVSGISLDEELINALQFQQIYGAASKIVKTTAEMLDTVIAMV